MGLQVQLSSDRNLKCEAEEENRTPSFNGGFEKPATDYGKLHKVTQNGPYNVGPLGGNQSRPPKIIYLPGTGRAIMGMKTERATRRVVGKGLRGMSVTVTLLMLGP